MKEIFLNLSKASPRLHALRYVPEAAPRARVILLHGYGDHSGRYADLVRHLVTHDIETVAFDFRGHGRSEGRRGFVRRWDEFLDDTLAVLHDPLLTPRVPTFLLGHSHGGLVAGVGLMRNRFTDVRGAVLSSPFLRNAARVPRVKHVLAWVGNVVAPSLRVSTGLDDGMMTHDDAMLRDARQDTLLNRCATPRWFRTTLMTQRWALQNASRLTTPYLALTGDADVIADPRGMEQFHARTGSTDKTLKVYPGLCHELLRETGRAEIFRTISDWMLARSG